MPFLNRDRVDPDLRARGEDAYRARLRQMLEDPTLTNERRSVLKLRIAAIGRGRVYDANSSPPPGAVESVSGSEEV